jgi:GH18 family chitinase
MERVLSTRVKDLYGSNCWMKRVGTSTITRWNRCGEQPDELKGRANGPEGRGEEERVDANQPKALKWVEYWDESVETIYYYNTTTGEASWTTPEGGYVSANTS